MRTASVTDLFDADFNFARLRKDGTYEGQKKRRKDTTHLLEETKISVVATPLKSWPKHKSKNAGYGKPRYTDMQVPTNSENRLNIPNGATHFEYSTSRIALVDTVNHVQDVAHMRGQLRFGILRAGDRFEYLDEGTELKDGTCLVNKDKQVERVVREHPELPKPPKKKAADQPSPYATMVLPKPPAKKTPSQPVATGKTPSAKVARPPKPAGGESVCGFIDKLIEEGGRTKVEICALVLKKFPDRNEKSTLNTIGVRPTHMRAAGRTPQPFKK